MWGGGGKCTCGAVVLSGGRPKLGKMRQVVLSVHVWQRCTVIDRPTQCRCVQ